MARRLDFGEADQAPIQDRQPDFPRLYRPLRATLTWNCQGRQTTTHLFGKALLTCGRASTSDICLRVCPTSSSDNAEKTRQISGLHCLLRYTGDQLQLIDKSSNGTSVSSRRQLQRDEVVAITDGEQIDIAAVLTLAVDLIKRKDRMATSETTQLLVAAHLEDAQWLTETLVGQAKSGILDFARLRRVSNLPDEEYVLLFGHGLVGQTKNALIRLESTRVTQPWARALDLGEAVGEPVSDAPASFYWGETALHFQCNISGQVRLNGAPVSAGEDLVLSGGEAIQVVGQTIQVLIESGLES